MVAVPEVRTERLLLRGWTDDDRPAHAAINADPRVMATIGPLQAGAQTDAAITPCVEVGWRLSSAHWGNGYAPEAGRAALDFASTSSGWPRSCRSLRR